MSATEVPLPTGTTIGENYKIIKPLGKGGNGRVYKAENKNGSLVAIKEAYFEFEEELKRFRTEAKLLSSLSDEGFPKVIDHFSDGANRYFLIMELIEGDDLA
jgi:eukaryotic-like serine/threonine-protein kinase